jgi:oxygen-dependent protoporphyrinogen oxidase
VPTKVTPFVTSRLFSWPGKLRMALDLVLPRKRRVEDETLGDFIRRRFGSEALEKLGEPLVAGIHSGDPETMSVKATFPRFLQMEQEERSLIIAMLRRMRAARRARDAAARAQKEEFLKTGSVRRAPSTMFMTLDDGLGLLVEELVRRLGPGTVRTDEPAVSLQRDEGGGWKVSTARGEHTADAVVLASPAYVTAGLIEPLDTTLAEELRGIPYVSSATVTLAYRRAEFPTEPDGFGAVIPKGEQRAIKAFSWVTTKFFGRAPDDVVLLRVFIRATGGETEGKTEAELADMARGELESILGVRVAPLWSRAYRWDRAMPQYVVGHVARVERIERQLEALPGLVLAGGAYRGSGIPDTVRVARERSQELITRFVSG